MILGNGRYFVKSVPRVLCQEGHYTLGLKSKRRGVVNRDALFLCAAVVVFVFYLKECGVAIDVRAHPYLFASCLAIMVHCVHQKVGRVEIDCVVRCNALAIYLLDVILPLDSREKLVQLRECGDKFCIGAVH